MVQVSVIVAAWNAEDTIERCIQSILCQENVDLEVIIVNDCSTDQTADKIEYLVSRCPQVSLASTKRNSGPSAARNIGLELARGEWIGIVDADDTIEPGRLAKLLGEAALGYADICFDNLKFIQANGCQSETSVLINTDQAAQLHHPWSVESYTKLNKPYESSFLVGFLKPLVRSAFLRQNAIRYNDDLYNSEDYLFVLECLIRGARIRYIDSPLYNYYVNASSLSGKFDPKAHKSLIVAERRLLDQFGAILSKGEYNAIEGHIKSLEMAGVTNEIFSRLRNCDIRGLTRIALADRQNLPVHIGRIGQSLINKIFKISNRGR